MQKRGEGRRNRQKSIKRLFWILSILDGIQSTQHLKFQKKKCCTCSMTSYCLFICFYFFESGDIYLDSKKIFDCLEKKKKWKYWVSNKMKFCFSFISWSSFERKTVDILHANRYMLTVEAMWSFLNPYQVSQLFHY